MKISRLPTPRLELEGYFEAYQAEPRQGKATEADGRDRRIERSGAGLGLATWRKGRTMGQP